MGLKRLNTVGLKFRRIKVEGLKRKIRGSKVVIIKLKYYNGSGSIPGPDTYQKKRG